METAKRADEALAAHGFDGDKLLAYAHTIARREMNRKGSTLGDRHQDLVMFLVEQGCRTAVKYDPDKSASTYKFSSYVYDVMQRRVTDFYRRKGEGFGDKRRGQDNRVVLTGDRFEHEDEGDFTEAVIARLSSEGREQSGNKRPETIPRDHARRRCESV